MVGLKLFAVSVDVDGDVEEAQWQGVLVCAHSKPTCDQLYTDAYIANKLMFDDMQRTVAFGKQNVGM
jgi:hypothetical protein